MLTSSERRCSRHAANVSWLMEKQRCCDPLASCGGMTPNGVSEDWVDPPRRNNSSTWRPGTASAHVAEQKDRVGIHFLTNEHQMPIWQNGRELRPGMIAVSPPDTEHYCRTSTGVCWGSMSLSLADLAAAGRALVDCEITSSAVAGLIQPPPHLMTRLLNLQEAAGRLAAAAPDILEHPEVSRAMEQTLIHVIVRCLEDLAIGPKSYSHQRGSV